MLVYWRINIAHLHTKARRCSTKVKPGVELMKNRFKDYTNKSSLSNPNPVGNPTWLKRGGKDSAAFGVLCSVYPDMSSTELDMSSSYQPVVFSFWQVITVGVGIVVTSFFLQVCAASLLYLK